MFSVNTVQGGNAFWPKNGPDPVLVFEVELLKIR